MMIVAIIRMMDMVNWAMTRSFLKGELVDPVADADFMTFTGESKDK